MFSLLKLVWLKTEKKRKCSCICSFAVPVENIVIFTLSSYFSNHFFYRFQLAYMSSFKLLWKTSYLSTTPSQLPAFHSRSRCNSTRQPQAHRNAMNRTKKVNRQGQKIRVLTKHPTRTLSLLQVCVNVFDNFIPFKIEFFLMITQVGGVMCTRRMKSDA